MLPRRDFLLMLVCCATLCAAAAPSQVHAKDGGKDSGGNDNSGKDNGGDDGGKDNSGKDDGGDDGGNDNSGKDDGGDDDGGDNSGKDDGGDDDGGDDDGGKDNSGKNRNDNRQKTLSHNEALKEKKTGDVIPLERALKIIAGKFEGKVIDVKLTRSFGRQQYRVKLRARTGVIKTVRLDAKTGRFIGMLGF